MQKKLIAVAVAGALAAPLALAQTNVTISGKVSAGYDSYKVTDCTATQTCRNESRVSDQSSRIIFNVSEDLGSGLKAWAQMDMRYANDLGGIGMTGNTGIGLQHNTFGKFTLGRWDVHYGEFAAIEGNRAGSLQTLHGVGIMSQVAGGGFSYIPGLPVAAKTTVGNGTRTPNLIMWDSPNLNGFTGRFAYSTGADTAAVTGFTGTAATITTGPAGNEGSGKGTTLGTGGQSVGDAGDGSAWTAALRYNNGPWAAGFSHWNSKSEDGRNGFALTAPAINPASSAVLPAFIVPLVQMHSRSSRAWLGYTFAMGLKIGFGWDQARVSITDHNNLGFFGAAGGSRSAKRNAWMVPVSYTFGPHAVYGTYTRAGSMSGSAIAPGTGGQYKARQWTLGYDYAFSKRTSAGVFYTHLENDSNAAGSVGGAYDLFAVGANGGTATTAGNTVRQYYFGMAHSF